jgi:hypothetical protein
MNDFGKKLITFGIVAVLMFGVLAAITWFKVNSYDEGEFVMNTAQAIATALGAVFLAQLKSVFGAVVLVAVTMLAASPVHAGPFGLFNRYAAPSCVNGQCSQSAVPQQATTITKEHKAAAAAPAAPSPKAAGSFTDRDRKIIDRFDGSRRAVLKRLQSDAKLRERFAAEWNKRYMEKVDAADWKSILEVILKYLPQVLEILLKLI